MIFIKENQISSKKKNLIKPISASMLLALALVLPLLTGQLKELGNAFCPMHVPVLLCGFFCGPLYGAAVGLIAPLLRFLIFGMPPLYPIGAAMCFELAVYGLTAGLLYRALPKKKGYVYVSLIGAMLTGRAVWGAVRAAMVGLGGSSFGFSAFLAGAFTNAVPGIILQVILIPVLVFALERAFPDITDVKRKETN